MEPEDPKLADVIGHIYEAENQMEQARPLMALVHIKDAKDAIEEYVELTKG